LNDRNVVLSGFEEALADAIAAGFRFAGEPLEDVALVRGRHIFVGHLPSIEQVKGTVLPPATFDEKTQPVLALYTAQPSSAIPSACDSGQHEYSVELALRIPGETQRANALLAELLTWIAETLVGENLGDFAVGSVGRIPAPTPFRRLSDGSAVATARVRFFVIALNR
jgi:hypothetical protein